VLRKSTVLCCESRLDQVNNRASYTEFIPDTIRLVSNQFDILKLRISDMNNKNQSIDFFSGSQ
jgi:hypothetical protein